MKSSTIKKHKKTMKNNIISYATCFVTCVAFYFASCFAYAVQATAEKINFLERHQQDLTQIESYLNNIKTLSAKFIQESSDGNTSEGKFFLSRPGKMRVEYSGQPKTLIIVNGSVLAYQDIELDETSYLSTNTTPASFLTRPTDFTISLHILIFNLLSRSSLAVKSGPLLISIICGLNSLSIATSTPYN